MKTKKILKRIVYVLLGIVGLILIVAILSLIFSGRLAKKYIEKHDKELIGREITVERIIINPLLGTLTAHNFTLYEKDDKTPFLKFDHLKYRMNLWALLNKKVKVNKTEIDHLYARLIQSGYDFNIDDILTRFSKSDKKKKSNWIIDLNNITLIAGNIQYQDAKVNGRLGLDNVNIKIPRVYLAGKDTDAGITLNFEGGGFLKAALAYNTDKSSYNLKLDLKNFDSGQILPYLQQHMNISKTKGALSLNANIIGETEHIINATVCGDLSYTNGQVIDNKGAEVFAVDSIKARIAKFCIEDKIVELEKLSIFGPKASYTINKENTTNFTNLFKESSDTTLNVSRKIVNSKDDEMFLKEIGLLDSSGTNIIAEKTLKLYIGDLHIQGGDVTYTDHTLPKVFTYHLSEISASCQNFALNKTNKIKGNAVLGKTGKVSLDWVSDFKSMRNMDLALILNNINLTDFTPYSYHYLGNNIVSGTMRLLSHNTVTDNKLKGENLLEIYKPKVSKRENKNPIYKLPVRLGVYVLTDRKDNMKVSLPVSGDLDNPKFSYIRLLFKALGNVLIKVSTAPFTALGDLISPDSESFDTLEIDAKAPDFSPQQYAKLEELVNWMQGKKEMKFEFIQWVSMKEADNDSSKVFTQERIFTLAKERNENLKNYLLRMKLPKERFTIAPIVLDSLKNYKGKDKFTIVSSLDGDDEDYMDINSQLAD